MEHALIAPPSRASNAPHQIRILNALSAETLLLARCFVRSQDLPAYGIPLPEANRCDRLNRVKSLLEAGADPNIIVGIYKGDNRLTVERLEPNADKVEWLDGTSHDKPSYIVRSWTQSVARGLTRQCSPIVESITDWDHALTTLLARHGARLNDIIYYLCAGFMTERTRYLDSGEQRFIERLLKSQVPMDRPLQRWVTSTLEEHLLGQASFFCAYLLTTEEQIARLKRVRRAPLELPEEAIQCIERNPTLLTTLSHGVPETLVAAVVDDLRLLPIALRNGSQVSAADSRGLTALHIAVGSVTTAFCQRLIELGADPDTHDSIGVTPLMEAVYYGNDAAAQLLLSAGADPSPGYQSAIRKLMTAKSDKTALRLLRNGLRGPKPPDVVLELPKSDSHGPSFRVFMGNRCVPQPLGGQWRLLRDEAFEQFASLGWSILHIAVWHGSQSMLELLLSSGTDVTCRAIPGGYIPNNPLTVSWFANAHTALDLAIELSRDAIAFLLLEYNVGCHGERYQASQLLERAIREDRHLAAERLKSNSARRPPRGRFASFERLNYDRRDIVRSSSSAFLVRRGPPQWFGSFDSRKFVWTLASRLPLTVCTHGQHEDSAAAISNRQASVTTRPSLCSLCTLLHVQKECLASNHHLAGPVMGLALGRDEEAQTRCLITKLGNVERQHPIRPLPYASHRLLQAIAVLDDSSSGSSAATATARHWLDTCIEKHQVCRARPRLYHPTRLVELLGGNSLRLVHRSHSVRLDEPYVTLSHRWGLDETSRTTLSNLEQRLLSFPAEELSPTMRDAITVVRGLGYHFLWIDALCIIQDSDEDWLHEASEMSFVYNNAVLTLAAANSTSPDEGMFRKRDFQKLRPFQFRHVERFTGQDLKQYLDFSGDLAEELYIFPATNGVQSGVRPKGVLDTRGWILQEQLLSPRILYYGQNQIYWDCVTLSASELSPVSASLLEDTNPDETWAFRVLRRATAGSGDVSRLRENIADIWFHVIQNYSARFLSNPMDKLIAIQGIIQAVERLLNVPSVAGMWEQNLWKQLIWWRKDRTTIAAPQDANTQSFGPTWSWLNADGPVSYCKATDSSEFGRAFVDLVPVVRNISVITQYEPAAAHTQSALELSGPSFSCKLTAEDFKRTLIGRRWESLSVGTKKLGSVRWLLDRPIDSLLNLECVVLGEDDVAKELVALCLVEDETTPGQHKRAGLCQWDGLQWQVARFMGSEADKLEEKTFTIV